MGEPLCFRKSVVIGSVSSVQRYRVDESTAFASPVASDRVVKLADA